MLRIVRQLLHPIAKLRRMHAQVLRRLCIGHASILDQAHSFKLELPRKLPPLHDAPPVPSKHLTRCLRNRVQASWIKQSIEGSQFRLDKLLKRKRSWYDWTTCTFQLSYATFCDFTHA